MEELVINISLDDLVEIEGFSVRTQNLCEYNNLIDLNSILNYYWINGDFLRLRNCGKMTNLKLIETCIKYESFIIKPNIEEDTEIEYYPENKFEPLLDETKAITLKKETIINNLIKTKFDELSVRSSNALRNCLNNDISLSNLKLILLAKESSIRNIHNIGEKSTTEIKDFIKSIKELIELVNTMEIEIETTIENKIETTIENEKETTIQIFNSFLKRTFSLSSIFINEIGKDYDFTAGMPIFKTLNVLIENGKIFHNRNNEIFKWGFSYYRELNFYSSDELADRLGITRERTRQMRLKLYEKLVSAFSFVRELEFNDLNLYGIDFTNNILEIDNELIIEINKNEGTNFNALFINKILSILLYFQFTLIGDEEGILFNRNTRTSHNWNTTYLILNSYVKIFDFEGLVEDVSFRLGQRIEEDYSFHFQTYLLDFQKEVCISFIEKIAQIAEYILFKEFELTIDSDENIIFKRNIKMQVIDFVYEVLENKNKPTSIYEIYDIIEQKYPGIIKNPEALRARCQGDSNLIYFGRSSTYGLKVWEEELNIKGGTIRDIAEEYLQNQCEPKHIDEITEYVNNFRNTNSKNIYANLKMDENLRFKFFAGLFIGVPQKEYDNEKYICVEDLGIERNTWEERFSSLQKFVNENRRLPNAKGGDQEVKLNRFMNIQINKANKGDLDNERISLILALASKYNYKKRKRDTPKTWDESYSLVREFVQKYQRLPIANDEDEKSIYQFFYRQRKLYLEHNLPLNFIDRFLEIANLLNDKI